MVKKTTDEMTLVELFELVATDLAELNTAVRRAYALGNQQARRGRDSRGQVEAVGVNVARTAGRGLAVAATAQEAESLSDEVTQLQRQAARVGKFRRSRFEARAREQLLAHHEQLRKLIDGMQTQRGKSRRR